MQTVQPELLQHSGYSHNCANQRLQPQLRLCGSGYSHNCPVFKGPVSAVSFALCLQSRPLCFEKYTSLVPSAFCSDICQAKKVSTILWTPNPSTDQAGTAAIAAFSTNILAMAFPRGPAAKVKPGQTTAGANKPKQHQVGILKVSYGKTQWSGVCETS